MPPMPAEAEAPPDLLTPATPSAGRLRLRARAVPARRRPACRDRADRDRESCGPATPDRRGRRTCPPAPRAPWRRRARRAHRAPSPLMIVGRDRRLLVADQDAQADIVAFGALRFLDRAVAHVDRQRDRAHGDRVGLVGAGAPRRGDQALGEIGEGGLIEQRGHLRLAIGLWGCGRQDKARGGAVGRRCARKARVSTASTSVRICAALRQPLVNHAAQSRRALRPFNQAL